MRNIAMVNNFTQRTLTGILFVIIMVAAIVIHPFAFGILFLAVTILGLTEFYRLMQADGRKPSLVTGITGSLIVYCLLFCVANGLVPADALYALWLILPLVVITELFSRNPEPFSNIASTVLGILYVALPFSLLNWFYYPRKSLHEPAFEFLLGYFIILWLNDTGAYLTGRSAGRHLLFQRISPKKTWEGIAGGLIVGLLAAWGLSRFFTQLSLTEWIILAILIIFFGTLGDLAESMLKRSVNVKDSGTLLPGHGGILDRFDGVLLSAPVVYLYFYLLFN